ncbi:ABC transporter, periplasmic substrate-binding protein [Geotalea daltonii FRC-32]|uniref:ABC transporter, periplasmic substrate-binding protein n=1 Tax=Geotalea daltonii (strain DSM 22248 / JCM 15807 / FRC-32) TaxID=316067 RepID=B9M7N8_GEODF|nr:phosphate/phosphite/phosphonate ABC transporter substrate-binding protein [Geotalea daltonii]ACM22144.1 ABC transporter, periplasmic substrate-binding protein [Geotalea daltonii FRC-32]
MSRFELSLLAMSLLVSLTTACTSQDSPTPINTSRTEVVQQRDPTQGNRIRIALGGMITPKEGLAYYREFLEYLGRQIGQPVEYVDAEDYAEINRKLETGELEAAFVCSGPYVDGKEKFGLEFIAAPQAYGEKVYYSYFIVPSKSQVTSLDGLKGKSFAFTDPLSNSGKLVPEYTLARMGTTPERFFSKISYSGSHDKSIKAVSEGLVDGAAVDSLIWEYKNQKYPEQTANTRIIFKSKPYAPPPFVVRPGLDPAIREKLRQVMLNAHKSPEGKVILSKMMIDRFVPLNDSAYDSVRQIKLWVDKPKPGKPR